jgi:hypothetical protein
VALFDSRPTFASSDASGGHSWQRGGFPAAAKQIPQPTVTNIYLIRHRRRLRWPSESGVGDSKLQQQKRTHLARTYQSVLDDLDQLINVVSIKAA